MRGPIPISVQSFGRSPFLGHPVRLIGAPTAPQRAVPRMGQPSEEIVNNLRLAERALQGAKKAYPKITALMNQEKAQAMLDQAQASYEEALEAYVAAGGQ